MNPKDTLFWTHRIIEEIRSSKELVKQCPSLYHLRVCPDNTASQSENIVIAFFLFILQAKDGVEAEKKHTINIVGIVFRILFSLNIPKRC